MDPYLPNSYGLNVSAPGLFRFNSLNDTCPGILYENFIDGIFKKFQDSFFFITFLQFVIVTLMYSVIGKGRYWKILFYSAIFNMFASLTENVTVAYICTEAEAKAKRERNLVVPFLFAEVGWIIGEFSIPFLNLTKMGAFSKGRANKIINWIILGFFFPLFILFRFYIGYARMVNGVLQSMDIRLTLAFVYAFLAVTDLICTISILIFVRNNNKRFIQTSSVNHYIKHSSYTILLLVDAASVLLAFFNAISQYHVFGIKIPESFANPFQCLKCGFILILSVDALLFKYGITTSSTNSKYSSSNYKSSNSFNKSRTNYSTNATYANYTSSYNDLSSYNQNSFYNKGLKVNDSKSSNIMYFYDNGEKFIGLKNKDYSNLFPKNNIKY